MKIVTVRLPLESLRLLRDAIGWNASKQPELRKHLDRVVEEIRCNLKIIERSEASGYVVLERSVQVMVRIVDAGHDPSLCRSSGDRAPGGWPVVESLSEAAASLRARAFEAVAGANEPHPRDKVEPSPPGGSIVVLTGRATRVPQAAVTSGKQRTTTVTSRRPMAGRTSLTWDGGGGRNCMACKCSRSVP